MDAIGACPSFGVFRDDQFYFRLSVTAATLWGWEASLSAHWAGALARPWEAQTVDSTACATAGAQQAPEFCPEMTVFGGPGEVKIGT